MNLVRILQTLSLITTLLNQVGDLIVDFQEGQEFTEAEQRAIRQARLKMHEEFARIERKIQNEQD